MGDGKKVQLACMWTKATFENIVRHAKQYDIIIADFEKAPGGAKKGGFVLEYLNGYVPPVPGNKRSLWWLWLLLLLLLLLRRKGKAQFAHPLTVTHYSLPLLKALPVQRIAVLSDLHRAKADGVIALLREE